MTRAHDNEGVQQAIREVCQHDPLFFYRAVCWLFEPRPKKLPSGRDMPIIIPFIPWSHQEPLIKQMFENLGERDMGMEKSRGEGASWITLMMFLNRWLFVPMSTFGLVSRTELAVDNAEDPDSLMWKLDWELTKLPLWMAGTAGVDYQRNRAQHSLKNLRNMSSIIGGSATGDFARGGRKTAIMMDELAAFPAGDDQAVMDSTQHVTECRIVISTPQGRANKYAEIMQSDSDILKLILDWKDNETRNRGLYRVVDGVPYPIDVERYGDIPDNYKDAKWWEKLSQRLTEKGYDLEARLRSPWYDRQCLRPGATPQSIAQELDRDYGGSKARIFSAALIERVLKKFCHEPKHKGELTFSRTKHDPRWMPVSNGKLRLWFPLGAALRPKPDLYVIGGDIAMGTGSEYGSNSALSVTSLTTGKKVAEFASPRISPQNLAHYAVAMCNWFRSVDNEPALLIWETNGPGGQFTTELKEIGFRHVWYRKSEQEFGGKASKRPGWNNNSKDGKKNLLGNMAHEMIMDRFINPSKEAIQECTEYILDDIGRAVHERAENCPDPSGAKDNHGDRVIADALCVMVLQGQRRRQQDRHRAAQNAPSSSYAARRERWIQQQKRGNKSKIWTFGA
jgi:hypothetical protein